MTFFNPMVLFGLAAASVPLILHLLNLRKMKKIEFSSLKFLKELQKTKIRRLKLKKILLLILRTLAIIFAVLAFARPTINSNLPLLGNYANTGTVILLDNSMSMDVSDEYGNRFNQAKNSARTIIDLLKEGDEVAIIPMSNLQIESEYLLSRNLDYIKNELNNVKPSYATANLEKGLRTAEAVLENSLNLSREVFVLSDAQPNIFEREYKDSSIALKNVNNLFFMQIGNESKNIINNISIDSVALISQIFRKDKPVETEFFVQNHSKTKIDALSASVMYNGIRSGQRTLDLQPDEKKNIFISANASQIGLNSAYIEIESDALDGDNKRYFGFLIPEKPKIALVGTPAQTHFLSLALGAKFNNESLIDLARFNASDLARIDMNKFDIIVCAGGPYRETDFQRLEQYARGGGNIMIFADKDTPRDIFNLGISLLGFGGISDRVFSEEQPASFTKVDRLHPLFSGVFKGTTESKEIVESPKIYKAFTTLAGQQIIEIPGGAFLSESRIGDGKVLYCAVTADQTWSNFPFTGLFPTFAFRSSIYLSSKEQSAKFTKVGSSINIVVPRKYSAQSNFKVIDPNNTEYFIQAVQMPAGTTIALNNLQTPGCYKIYSNENDPVAVVAVNTDKSESDLNILGKSDIESNLEKILNKNVNVHFIDNISTIKNEVLRARIGTELWQIFVVLTLLCLLTEMLVAKYTKAEAGIEA